MLFPLFFNHSSHTLWCISYKTFLRISLNQMCSNSLVLTLWKVMWILANIFQNWKLLTKSFCFPLLQGTPLPTPLIAQGLIQEYFESKHGYLAPCRPTRLCVPGEHSCWGSTMVPQWFQLSSARWQQLDTAAHGSLIKTLCPQIWPENNYSIIFQEKGRNGHHSLAKSIQDNEVIYKGFDHTKCF